MRIALGTIEVDAETRLLIGEHYGDSGMADRGTCRRAIISNGTGWLDTLALDAKNREEFARAHQPDGEVTNKRFESWSD